MNCQVVGKLFDVLRDMSGAESSDISFLKTVSGTDEINAVEISHRMNVTRSAVTQMSNKLEDRGLIEKYAKPDNKKEKYIRLTREGERTLAEYEKQHEEANERMCNYLSGLSNDERDTLIGFLDNLEKCMPISNFECMGRRIRGER